jgi:hypothetical protein
VSLPATKITAGSWIVAQVMEIGAGESLSIQTLVLQLFEADSPGITLSQSVYAGIYFNPVIQTSPTQQAAAIASGFLVINGVLSAISSQEPLLTITGASSIPAVATRGSQVRVFNTPGQYVVFVGNASSVDAQIGLSGALQYQLAN